MTMNVTDPSEVRLTGDNPVMRIYADASQPPTTMASVWRVVYSAGGPGHVLFLISDALTNKEPLIYTDNMTMLRWLQGELIAPRWAPFNDPSLPASYAQFSRSGDARDFLKETISAPDDEIVLTWYDLLESYCTVQAPNTEQGQRHGHYALHIPARHALVSRNGKQAPGDAIPQEREGYAASSCFYATAETWVRLRE